MGSYKFIGYRYHYSYFLDTAWMLNQSDKPYLCARSSRPTPTFPERPQRRQRLKSSATCWPVLDDSHYSALTIYFPTSHHFAFLKSWYSIWVSHFPSTTLPCPLSVAHVIYLRSSLVQFSTERRNLISEVSVSLSMAILIQTTKYNCYHFISSIPHRFSCQSWSLNATFPLISVSPTTLL